MRFWMSNVRNGRRLGATVFAGRITAKSKSDHDFTAYRRRHFPYVATGFSRTPRMEKPFMARTVASRSLGNALLVILLGGLACASPDAPAVTAPDGLSPVLGRGATAPNAPTNVRATAGDAQATVTWQAPKKNGGSAITAYRVVTSPGGVTVTVGASPTSATVNGLTNGTTYTFTVYARNAIGESGA